MANQPREHLNQRRAVERLDETRGVLPGEDQPYREDRSFAASRHVDRKTLEPHARTAEHALRPDEKHDHLADRAEHCEDRQEALIDEAVEETFPASDPISPKHIT